MSPDPPKISDTKPSRGGEENLLMQKDQLSSRGTAPEPVKGINKKDMKKSEAGGKAKPSGPGEVMRKKTRTSENSTSERTTARYLDRKAQRHNSKPTVPGAEHIDDDPSKRNIRMLAHTPGSHEHGSATNVPLAAEISDIHEENERLRGELEARRENERLRRELEERNETEGGSESLRNGNVPVAQVVSKRAEEEDAHDERCRPTKANVVCVVLLFAIIFGVSFGLLVNGDSNPGGSAPIGSNLRAPTPGPTTTAPPGPGPTISPAPAPAAGPTTQPTPAPTPGPTTPPTLQPTTPPPTPGLTPPPTPASSVRFEKVSAILANYAPWNEQAMTWLTETDTWEPDNGDPNSDYLWMERYVMADFYFSTNGPQWQFKDNWLSSQPVCDWYIKTTNICPGPVTEFIQWGNRLTGSIPSSIGNLILLTNLTLLSNRQLAGSIPSSIGNLSQLQKLSISGSQLTGSIPSSIGNLSQLTYLDFYTNQLTGSIPSSIGNLGQLTYLALYVNQLTGSIPSSIGNLSMLTSLNLRDNKLVGSVPVLPSSIPDAGCNLSSNCFQDFSNAARCYMTPNCF